MTKTFFITETDSGLGLAIAKAATAAGNKVIGTTQSPTPRSEFNDLARSVPIVHLDARNLSAISGVVEKSEAEHGPVDILINHSSHTHEGTIEESPVDDMVRQFEASVFGTVAVAKAFIPQFRQRRSGHIINISSMAGMIGFPGFGYYCSSKFALQGISEAMRAEMAPFGVRVTAVCPGSFDVETELHAAERGISLIEEYNTQIEAMSAKRRTRLIQAGDPAKFASAILAFIDSGENPAQLLFGSDTVQAVSDKILRMHNSMNQWRSLSRSIDRD